MKSILVLCLLLFAGSFVWAAQRAKILGELVEVYEQPSFDSDVIYEVYKDEVYKISDKTYGAFYRIQYKDKKLGYIVDYELDIDGKGRLKEKDLDEMELIEALQLKNPTSLDPRTEIEEQEVFGKNYAGPVLQIVNYHEDSRGSEQIDELVAIGYKSLKTFSWSLVGTTKVPKYYTEAAGNSATGFKLWADVGVSSEVAQFPGAAIRFAGNVFTHFSSIQLQTPVQKYDLQDITAGVNLELAFLKKFSNFGLDFSIKYYFDKSRYAALGVSVLF